MPTINVQPAVFMVHRGITIFHNYKEWDYPVDDPMTYLYSLDVTGDDILDVRDLPVPEGVESNSHEDIIAAAIDSGELDTGDQVLDGESDYELSEGQKWLLANVHNVKNPVHTGDIPELKNIDMEIFALAEDCQTPEDIASKRIAVLKSVEDVFNNIFISAGLDK
ncbi:MAG: hypothetical protein GY774_23150 [Planctomycetes bacterium]|nr:hypothetical protein [Planctomycetota bacterium]